MSNEMRDLLHGAAAAPSGPPDLPRASRRGRRLRTERRALSALAIVVIVAIGSAVVAGIAARGGDHDVPPATISPTPATCSTPNTDTPIPSWAKSANPPPGIPRLQALDGDVLAVLFAHPLIAPPAAGAGNKILWVVHQPRDGKRLSVTATLPGTHEHAVRESFPADSGPGEIYPSGVNVPEPGCWHFSLSWNGHRSAINLLYIESSPGSTVAAPTTTASTSTTSTTVATTNAAPTTCRTADLALSLGPPIGSAGHMNYEIAFRNTGAAACVMDGFPGVSFLDAAGHQIGLPAGRNTLSPAPVTVAPGATAYAHIAVVDTSVQNCPPAAAHQISVYPPNETASAVVAVSGLQVCSDQTVGSTVDPVLDHPLG